MTVPQPDPLRTMLQMLSSAADLLRHLTKDL